MKVDMKESEDNNGLTRIEYTVNTEEYDKRQNILLCNSQVWRQIHMFPQNTSNCKTHPSALRALAGVTTEEEDIRSVNRVVVSDINGADESASDNTICATVKYLHLNQS